MSHHDHQEADLTVFHLTKSVDDASELASRGEAERSALRAEAGMILDAYRRLGNLVEHLGLLNRKEAA